MAKTVTPDAISIIRSNPTPDSSGDVPELVVQVLDLKATGNRNRFMFTANDGKMKLKGILPANIESEVLSGKIQNLGLIRILDYTLNDIPNKQDKYLVVLKCEAVSPALETEVTSEEGQEGTNIAKRPKLETDADVKSEASGLILKPKQDCEAESQVKREGAGIILKPKQEIVSKSAAQIVHEQHRNMAPAARLAMTRRVHPLVSLNPYQGNWTIKVRVTNKGSMRTYRNARGEGCVFNVELTDEDGTQIQATMFKEAAKKFYDKLEMGKVYYISKGTLKVANKQFKTVQNDYEMTLNEYSEVEEARNEETFIPETKFNVVPIDMLGSYVDGKDLVDIVGVVQSVSPTMSIRRKTNNETIPKRDIVVADETKKMVVVSLWNDLATGVGQELLDIVDQSPIVAIKSLKVGDFQGVSLSTLSRSVVMVNPDIAEAKKLRSWFDSEGKGTSMAPVGSGVIAPGRGGARSMYSDRVFISHITGNQSVGEDKPAYFNIRAFITFIKPDQPMWYRACKTCNKKVTEAIGSGFWCEGCQKNDESCSLRYIMALKVTDASGDAWLSTFNEEAENIIGCSADELDQLKSQDSEDNQYLMTLKQATWVPRLFRVSVALHEYNNERRQRITVRAVTPVDFVAESRYLLEEISKMKVSE
ncbi:replication protein A 70 kDa DNA-binding subunit B [Punica granatum]|uniref:Replication protein A subunit n=2 Tax=Punica granatum TaxID=22663 RepID=A0A218VYE0_PUNGR|nr:replication protein A 70 kDa DNA-binding subunit B [Punica granatum]OWM65228.1 hypothetical protein CDL15_Pgr008818 [Punica granatum]PKI47735.1 hypothetical protein CRG98_031868 [Punica granatum]